MHVANVHRSSLTAQEKHLTANTATSSRQAVEKRPPKRACSSDRNDNHTNSSKTEAHVSATHKNKGRAIPEEGVGYTPTNGSTQSFANNNICMMHYHYPIVRS